MSTVYIRFPAHRVQERHRSPWLERILVRAAGAAITDWRVDAMAAVGPSPAVPEAAAAVSAGLLWGSGQTAGEWPWACVASPVHLHAGMSSVLMPADGVLRLRVDEAAELADDFNHVFGGVGTRLVVSHAAHLVCEFDRINEAVTHDPETMVGRDVFAFQPSGRDAKHLRRVMTEVEMWLFDHAVNRVRLARGLLPVTGLWLWGGARTGGSKPAYPAWAAGDDVCFSAFGSESEWPQPRGARLGAGVVVCTEQPGTAGWRDVEARWLAPAWAELRAGRLGQVVLSAERRRVSLKCGGVPTWWRRSSPWWESFNVGEKSDGIQ